MTTVLGIAVMVLLAFAACGAGVSYRDAQQRYREGHASPYLGETDTGGGGAASAHERDPGGEIAQPRYLDAWAALGGRDIRLHLLAIASNELSQRCREAALAGLEPPRVLAGEDYCFSLPTELSGRVGRPGDPVAWQAMDRALKRLSAIIDTTNSDAHADAHEQMSIAARDLAGELSGLGVTEDLDHCWFCGRGRGAVERLLYSAHAAICSDCVQVCHARLHELD